MPWSGSSSWCVQEMKLVAFADADGRVGEGVIVGFNTVGRSDGHAHVVWKVVVVPLMLQPVEVSEQVVVGQLVTSEERLRDTVVVTSHVMSQFDTVRVEQLAWADAGETSKVEMNMALNVINIFCFG